MARIQQNKLWGLFSCFNTPSEALWMLYQIMALLHAVSFNGDDGPVEWGFSPMQMALMQTDSLLCKVVECFSIQQSVDKSGKLEYPDYDVHRTMEAFFESHHPPSSAGQIPMAILLHPDLTWLRSRNNGQNQAHS
jgi:hypothetical protein